MEMQPLDLGRIDTAFARHANEAAAHLLLRLLAAEKDHRSAFAGGAQPIAQAPLHSYGELQRHRGFAAAAVA